MAGLKNYYASTNSSIGFKTINESLLDQLDLVYVLKGGTRYIKSSFMRKIGIVFMECDIDLEYYHCPNDNYAIEGLIAPALKFAIIDEHFPHIIKTDQVSPEFKVINLNIYQDNWSIFRFSQEIVKLKKGISESLRSAYQELEEAKYFFDKMDTLIQQANDDEHREQVLKSLIEAVFQDHHLDKMPQNIKERFFGTITPKGPVNFIENITEDMEKRILIKGRNGNDKSTLLKKIGKVGEERGFSIEYYPCGFIPTKMDMVIIPEIKVALINTTSPHQVDPYRKGDVVIDIDEYFLNRNVMEMNRDKFDYLSVEYENKLTKATNYLSAAKDLNDQLERSYVNFNDEALNKERNKVIQHIFSIIECTK